MQTVAQTLEQYKREYAELNKNQYFHTSVVEQEVQDDGLQAQQRIAQAQSRLSSLNDENLSLHTALSILERDIHNAEHGVQLFPAVSEKTTLEIQIYEADEQLNQAKERRMKAQEALDEAVQSVMAKRDSFIDARQCFQDEIEAVFSAVDAKSHAENLKDTPDSRVEDLLNGDPNHDALLCKLLLQKVKLSEEQLSKVDLQVACEVDAIDAVFNQVPEDSAVLEMKLAELRTKVDKEENANEALRVDHQKKACLEDEQFTLAALTGVTVTSIDDNKLRFQDNMTGDSAEVDLRSKRYSFA
eukprot:Plantae.Rhodophyta-Hildenbrandia_rubra.ctg8096.p1 GENE.Plantae.Rhodophyta-Hildenbrandia_rubra.ctg8096~~Plantae.Rhodophyta-Hildenbrandia_rubra.ctg8096.p1  ORF type:complete len:300 (+),score=61.77 Plantae.Rhodophyta-Hildenbrandia_rubra.ctg8096:1664-2563(+)